MLVGVGTAGPWTEVVPTGVGAAGAAGAVVLAYTGGWAGADGALFTPLVIWAEQLCLETV